MCPKKRSSRALEPARRSIEWALGAGYYAVARPR
jgi:hypothetical protein